MYYTWQPLEHYAFTEIAAIIMHCMILSNYIANKDQLLFWVKMELSTIDTP